MDISNVTDPQAKLFLSQFLRNRNVNREFFKLVPEDKLDFRMVDTTQRKSDSPRESLIHLIYITRNYIYLVTVGKQEWGDKRYSKLMSSDIRSYSKERLLNELEEAEIELLDVLSDSEIANKRVEVAWSREPVPAVTSLWGLDSHEVLHQGWNLAIMDHLSIPRFPALQEAWG